MLEETTMNIAQDQKNVKEVAKIIADHFPDMAREQPKEVGKMAKEIYFEAMKTFIEVIKE